ncbi:MAG: hypothetical protein ACFFDF_16735 [Candidatus Odinarchaeota archaeon]
MELTEERKESKIQIPSQSTIFSKLRNNLIENEIIILKILLEKFSTALLDN